MKLRTLLPVPLVLVALACGGARAATPPETTPRAAQQSLPVAAPGALVRFAGLRVMVFPLQGVRSDVSAEWRSAMGSDSVVGRAADRALEKALSDRGLASQWVFPPTLERAARRNPTYVVDPYRVRAGDALRVALRRADDPFAEPFSSQLRTLAGVSDTRYAVVPTELRLEPILPGTTVRPVLRLAVVDARGAQLVWAGEVVGTAVPAWSDAVLADLSQRVADLVVLR